MGRRGAHQVSVFFLLILSSLAFSLEVSSFSECYPDWPLREFWSTYQFQHTNPYISAILGAGYLYWPAFDSSEQGMGAQGLSLLDRPYFESKMQLSQREELADAGKGIDAMQSSLLDAKEASSAAHSTYVAAQPVFKKYTDMLQLVRLFTSFILYPNIAGVEVAADMVALSPYVSSYPVAYSASLQSVSSTYTAAESSARAVASKADEEYSFLSVAGAGSENYSSHDVNNAYFSAREYLSEGQRCQQDMLSSYKIAGYFSSSQPPYLPDFAELGFPSHLQQVGSASESSSIMQMARLHSSLKSARIAMEGEYTEASSAATGSRDELEDAVKALGQQEIGLIGDVPTDADSGKVLVGASYSGVLTGYARLKEDLKSAGDYLAESQTAYGKKKQQNYLADAIALAKVSEAVSSNALTSSELVRASAEAAVVAQGRLAEKKITEAEKKVAELPSTPMGMEAAQRANSLIGEAKASFNSASSLQTLGKKFVAYRNALDKATDAIEAASGTYEISVRQELDGALRSFSSFLSLAQSDGLDVEYERDILSEYQKIANGKLSAEDMLIIKGAVQELKIGVVLRLEAKYSYLEGDYAKASSQLSEFRKQDKSFLLPEFESISAYFQDGKLNMLSSVGHLSQIKAGLEKIAAEEEKRTQTYLSYLLSKNARLAALAETPMLGAETSYSASIYTENPSGISTESPVSFSVVGEVPLYSSDFSGGDEIDDAYQEKGKTTLILPSVAANSRLSFLFEKKETPAQITSSSVECKDAMESEAQVGETVSFIATRDLPVLSVQRGSPSTVSDAFALYSGRRFPLFPASSGEGSYLSGSITSVKSGARTAEFIYTVRQPFSVSQGERTYAAQQGGAKKASYEIQIAAPSIDCDTALVVLEEQFSASAFSVSSLGTEKVSQIKAAESGGATRLSFIFSPLRKGKSVSFAVSYIISDPQTALASSLAAAEQQVGTYRRSKDSLTLEQARLLASQNRTDEALSILSRMLQEGAQLTYSYADYAQFQQEKSDAESLAEEAEGMVRQLSGVGAGIESGQFSQGASAGQAAQLSSIVSKLRLSITSATGEAESKGYSSALQSVRKAVGGFHTSLASLAWKAASGAQDDYAAARKKSSAPGLAAVEQKITDALELYSEGEHLQSLQASSAALQLLSQALGAAGAQDEFDRQSTEAVRADFTTLQKQAEELLSKYSSQYSALSGTSKKSLPLTPSEAQKNMDDAQKTLASSSKSTLSPQQSLAAANASLSQLQSAYDTLQSSYFSLQSSATNSLGVAKIALAQVKKEATDADQQDAAQIGAEVSKAEGFLSASLYADSLLSSERAIKAANTFLAAKGSGSPDAKTLLLAALSLVFLCVAAYYFITRAKPSQKKEKRELPKVE